MHANEIILGGLAATGHVCPRLQPRLTLVPAVIFVIDQHKFSWKEYVERFDKSVQPTLANIMGFVASKVSQG